MAHVTRVAKWELLSNGQVSYTLRVDADPASDFTVTLTVQDAANATSRDAKLTAARTQAETLYDAALAAENGSLGQVGQQI